MFALWCTSTRVASHVDYRLVVFVVVQSCWVRQNQLHRRGLSHASVMWVVCRLCRWICPSRANLYVVCLTLLTMLKEGLPAWKELYCNSKLDSGKCWSMILLAMLEEIFVTKFEVDLTIRCQVLMLLMNIRYVILRPLWLTFWPWIVTEHNICKAVCFLHAIVAEHNICKAVCFLHAISRFPLLGTYVVSNTRKHRTPRIQRKFCVVCRDYAANFSSFCHESYSRTRAERIRAVPNSRFYYSAE